MNTAQGLYQDLPAGIRPELVTFLRLVLAAPTSEFQRDRACVRVALLSVRPPTFFGKLRGAKEESVEIEAFPVRPAASLDAEVRRLGPDLQRRLAALSLGAFGRYVLAGVAGGGRFVGSMEFVMGQAKS